MLRRLVGTTAPGVFNSGMKKLVIMALYRSPLTVTLWPSSFLKKNYYPSQTRYSSSWRQTFAYEWYDGKRPGAALLGTSSRRDETILARLSSEHTPAQRLEAGLKVFPPSPNCNVTQASPAHNLDCIGCHKS
ncbi:hypothetical protein TNCV_3427801 [Trichonephila clavipes]|nr:hypothetical protein TNCV_3427801 [Trichonephila clavipes]